MYQCADVSIAFDRFDPVGRATYRDQDGHGSKDHLHPYTTDSGGKRSAPNSRPRPSSVTCRSPARFMETIAHPE